MIIEKVDGTWNRVIVAGVNPTHFLVSHLIEGLVVMLIQSVPSILFVVFFLTEGLTWSAMLLMVLFLLLDGIAGILFGLLVSLVVKTVGASIYANMGFINPTMFISGELKLQIGFTEIVNFQLSGVIWPIQGMSKVMQVIGYSFPFASPVIALRSIVFKNSSVLDFDVQAGLAILSLWIIVPLGISFWLTWRK